MGLVDADGAIVATQVRAEVGLGEFELAVAGGNDEVAVDQFGARIGDLIEFSAQGGGDVADGNFSVG